MRESCPDTEKWFENAIAKKLPIRDLVRKSGVDQDVFLIDLGTLATNFADQYKLYLIAATILDFVDSGKMAIQNID